MTDANPPTGNAVNSSSLQNSSSSQHATIIPASESHQKDPTSKHSPVRSTKSGWDGKLRIGDSQRTGQNDHGHDGKEEEADEDDDDDDDEDDSSSNDNESQATQSQLLDSSSLATTAATSIHDDDAQLAHLAAAAAPGRTAILQTGPAVEGGPPIDADEDLLDEYDSDAEEIDLVHCRVSSLAHLQLQRFAQLQRLCLRQNAIEDMAELPAHLAPELVELDLYDNLLRHIRGLDGFVKLRSLDLSFNNIKHIKRVAQCTELTDLYFVQNKISTIENLEGLSKLRNLELGGNRLRSIDGLETLTGLEELWLGKNKITEIKGLSTLSNLTILSIQSNRLHEIAGLENLAALEELHISHNALTRISGLEHNTNLRVIDISSNPIAKLEGLEAQEKLEELWASNCKLDSFEDVESKLRGKKELKTVYFEGNPLQLRQPVLYRNKVRLALPDIKQIDATYVHAER